MSDAGVKSDLLSIAQAERAYMAAHGSYASLDKLESSGELSFRRQREGYTYEAETSSFGFRVIARCTPPSDRSCTSYSIDQSMEVQLLP